MESFLILRCFFLFFFFVFFNGEFVAAEKFWSRIEMAEMNGYGEHKLSSVVITGSLLCNSPVSGILYIHVSLRLSRLHVYT